MYEYIQLAANIATIAGVPIAAGSLIYAGFQLSRSAKISQGQFMLELEKMIELHDEVHLKLRNGDWSVPNAGPDEDDLEAWAAVEDYMGLFEHCELLMRNGSLSPDDFKSLFGYRVLNLIFNDVIMDAKLKSDEREDWELFLGLIDRLKPLYPDTDFPEL